MCARYLFIVLSSTVWSFFFLSQENWGHLVSFNLATWGRSVPDTWHVSGAVWPWVWDHIPLRPQDVFQTLVSALEGRRLKGVRSGQAGIHPVGFGGQSHTSKWRGQWLTRHQGCSWSVEGNGRKFSCLGTFFQVSVYLPSAASLSCLHIWMWTVKYCWPVPESQEYPAVLLIFPYDWTSWILAFPCVHTCAHANLLARLPEALVLGQRVHWCFQNAVLITLAFFGSGPDTLSFIAQDGRARHRPVSRWQASAALPEKWSQFLGAVGEKKVILRWNFVFCQLWQRLEFSSCLLTLTGCGTFYVQLHYTSQYSAEQESQPGRISHWVFVPYGFARFAVYYQA